MVGAKKIVAYFDFDGTLSTKDTFIPFLLYCLGYLKFLQRSPRLVLVLFCYLLRIIDNQEAKQRTLSHCLSGWSEADLAAKAKAFAYTHLNKYLNCPIYAKLEWHREQGHYLVLVSANLAIYLRYFAQLHKIDKVIATEIELISGRVSGKLATANCYAAEKVIRIKDFLVEHHLAFAYSYGYGNSRGDHEMLAYVDEPYYVAGAEFSQYERQNGG